MNWLSHQSDYLKIKVYLFFGILIFLKKLNEDLEDYINIGLKLKQNQATVSIRSLSIPGSVCTACESHMVG